MSKAVQDYKHTVRGYGWIPDRPDKRDIKYKTCADPLPSAIPAKVDLRTRMLGKVHLMPPIYDQAQLGSCTANAIAGALEFEQRKQGLSDFRPSRLFIYYNERAMEGTVNSDSGAAIRDGITSVHQQGVCEEGLWSYDNYLQTFTVKPPDVAYARAKHHEALRYLSIDNTDINQIKNCVAAGFPVVFGFAVYASFESAQVAVTGVLNLPQPGEANVGGHAVVIVGYDDAKQRVIVRNSWSARWGQEGYFTMPYAYVTDLDLCNDFWSVRLIGNDPSLKGA